MSAADPAAQGQGHTHDHEQRVTPLELFFDLVFVFAFTQVTAKLADDPSWAGVGRGILVLTAVWWAWAAYSWLTNEIDPEEDLARLVVFAAMAAMLVVALAVPGAFAGDALLFGVAYLVVKALHVALFSVAAKDDPELRRAVLRLAPGVIFAPVMIIVASAFDGYTQGAIWAAALIIDMTAPIYAGTTGWHIAPGHFAERHGLIVIIALGESIVAIGAGVTGVGLDAGVIAAAILSVVVVACLWWIYFDIVALFAEERLREREGAERNRMARDSYSYLHLPMIAGIVLLAVGIKKTLPHIDDPLETIPAVALCGGVALYLTGHICFRLRNVRRISMRRVVTVVACLALIPVALEVASLIALAAIATVLIAQIAYEYLRFGDLRSQFRASHLRTGV